MGKIKLLLVEDDESLSFILKGCLELNGLYEVYIAENGKEGLALYEELHPDILVSDVEMPEMSGFELVRKIRETDSEMPIIFASALSSPKDLIDGLDLGADNFIRKPYLPEELSRQIIALLRRVKGVQPDDTKTKPSYTIGNYRLDPQRRILQYKERDKEMELLITATEAKILEILLEKKSEIVKRDELLIPLWGNSDFYAARSLDVFMTKIRKHLKHDAAIEIQTIRGEGYRLFVADAE